MPENQKICDSSSCLEYIDRFATYGTCYVTGKNVKRFAKCTNDNLSEWRYQRHHEPRFTKQDLKHLIME